MKINVTLDKRELPSPADLRQAINQQRRWAEVRMNKDLPVGALHDAIRAMEQTLRFVDRVYLQELNTENPTPEAPPLDDISVDEEADHELSEDHEIDGWGNS